LKNEKEHDQSGFAVPVRYSLFITLISFFGWTLAFMDSQFFGLLVPKIISAMSLSLNDISLVTLFSNIFGALASIIMGQVMDRRGRLLPFQLTLIFYSLGSLLTALSNNLFTLTGARSVVSFGTSPEGSVASVMVTENTSRKVRGIATGLLLLGVPVGTTIATIITGLVVVTAGLSFRVVFLIGIFPALLILLVRLRARESARYVELKRIKEGIRTGGNMDPKGMADLNKLTHDPIRQLFEHDLRRKSLVVMVFTTLASGVFFSILLFATEYLTVVKGLSYGLSLFVVGAGSSASIIGYIAATFIGQRIGRKETTIIFGLLGGVALLALGLSKSYTGVLVSYVLYQVFFAAIGSTFVALFAEMYPTRARGAGQSLNFASQSAGFAIWPLMFTATIAAVGWNTAFLLLEVVPLFISALSLFAIKRINPQAELEDIAI